MKDKMIFFFIGGTFIYFGFKIIVSENGYYFRDAFVTPPIGYLIFAFGIVFVVYAIFKKNNVRKDTDRLE